MLWENLMITEIMKQKANHSGYGSHYFWRVYSGAEIDLVEEKDGVLTGFEIKWKPGKKKAPPSWRSAYPDMQYKLINTENFMQVPDEV